MLHVLRREMRSEPKVNVGDKETGPPITSSKIEGQRPQVAEWQRHQQS